MSKDRDFKATAYYYIRRGWYDQLQDACDKKGKDNLGITTFWKAYGVGASGNISECIRQLSNFHTRPDMQYPVQLALAYFHQKSSVVDHEAISSIRNSLTVSEDVAKEVGLVLAARFSLISGDVSNSLRLCSKILSRTRDPSTPGELEAVAITHWCHIYTYMIENSNHGHGDASDLHEIESFIRRKQSILDVDLDDLMAWHTSKMVLGDTEGALNVLNQVTSGYGNFMPGYTEKLLLLSSTVLFNNAHSGSGNSHAVNNINSSWSDVLDLAYKCEDDFKSIDSKMVIAIHDLTQDMYVHQGIEKLQYLEKALVTMEPSNGALCYEMGSLFLRICNRQPRALQICTNMLLRSLQLLPNTAEYLCETGYCYMLQGQFSEAAKYYREASKKDTNNTGAIEGMILSQIMQQEWEDAESQIELLSIMGTDETSSSPQLLYIHSLLAYHSSAMHTRDVKAHMKYLEQCRVSLSETYTSLFTRGVLSVTSEPVMMLSGGNIYGVSGSNCLRHQLMALNPDLLFQVGCQYMLYVEPVTNVNMKPSSSIASNNTPQNNQASSDAEARVSSSTSNMLPEVSPAVKNGIEILMDVLTRFPSYLTAYVELARCYQSLGQYDNGIQILNKYLSRHSNDNDLPQECSIVLLFKAKVEIARCYTGHGTSGSEGSTKTGGSTMSTASIAEKLLEQSLSNDFSIRSQPLYSLVQIMIYSYLSPSKQSEALTNIEKLINSHPMEFKQSSTSVSSRYSNADTSSGNANANTVYNTMRITDDDRVLVYILRASLLSRTKRLKEANKILAEAKMLFAGTDNPFQEVQLLIATAQLAVERNDYDHAIRILDKISLNNPIFHKVQLVKASILFNYQRDREGYITCYKLLLEKAISEDIGDLGVEGDDCRQAISSAYSNLGDAYLRVLNPESAVEAFQFAYKYDNGPASVHLRVKIGKALVATHEYHRAVDFYEAALRDISKKQTESESRLKSKNNETISPEAVALSHDLARLYMKLGRYEAANRVLLKVIHDNTQLSDAIDSGSYGMGTDTRSNKGTYKSDEQFSLLDKQDDIKTLLLLTKVFQYNHNTTITDNAAAATVIASTSPEVIQTWKQIKKLQQEVVLAIRSGATTTVGTAISTTVEREKLILSTYCVSLGDLIALRLVNNTTSLSSQDAAQIVSEGDALYHEALSYNPHNHSAMLGLAKLYKYNSDLTNCIAQCRKVVMGNGSDAEGVILLSESLALLQQVQLQNKYSAESDAKGYSDNNSNKEDSQSPEKDAEVIEADAIITPLKHFLERYPCNFLVIEKLIIILRRLGKLQEIPAYFEAAEKYDKRSIAHSGYHYCKGLYCRYTNDVIQAIQHFNLSRKDIKSKYGESSLIYMIELYLNPDQDGIWAAAYDDAGTSSKESSHPMENTMKNDDTSSENIRVAEMLLQELRPLCRDTRRFVVLENYCLLATRQKPKFERAMNSFIDLLETDCEYLPAILGMATGFMIDKNQHKARNLLKRVIKLDASKQDGEDFEKANLFLAKFSADKTKNDNQTQELCKKCLVNNKSCSQAWDILGTSYEREGNFVLACECYEKAWVLEFEASAPMGFKYAYCLLKNKQNVEAIDICEKILSLYPDYPRIREEILRKAQLGIRAF